MLFVALFCFIVDDHCFGSEDVFDVEACTWVVWSSSEHLTDAAFCFGVFVAIFVEDCKVDECVKVWFVCFVAFFVEVQCFVFFANDIEAVSEAEADVCIVRIGGIRGLVGFDCGFTFAGLFGGESLIEIFLGCGGVDCLRSAESCVSVSHVY